jgi:hypothetical protein
MAVESLNTELVNLKKSGENSQVEVSAFLLETKKHIETPNIIAENLLHLKANCTDNTSIESVNIKIIKLMEQIIEQNETNIKNLKAYIDSERNNLLNSLRDSEFDELSMLTNRQEEKTLIDNRHSLNIKNLNNETFSLNDIFLIGQEKTFISDSLPAAYLVLNLNIPSDTFPDMYDGAELRISINNRTPFGKNRTYYRTIIIKVPRISNILSKEGSFLKSNFYPGVTPFSLYQISFKKFPSI